MSAEPILLSWSGGKDSCLALQALRQDVRYDVRGLLTTIGPDDRIAIHGVPRTLIDAQAAAIGLPIDYAPVPPGADNRAYEAAVAAALARPHLAKVGTIAFGDLFLADIRTYRERTMAALGHQPLFPLWGRDTRRLLDTFVDDGFRSIVVAVDTAQLEADFAGRAIDARFASELPPHVDPCGERGEYHSFVCDGPIFARPVPIRQGRRHIIAGFAQCEINPA